MPPKKTSQIIGITGGIATGKSTTTKILRDLGYTVLCADEMAHAALDYGTPASKRIIRVFGKEILDSENHILRKKIAEIVFKDETLRKKLEEIVHPVVIREIKEQIDTLENEGLPVIFIDVPLLFETNMHLVCDKTICISAHHKIQIQRLKQSRKMPEKQAKAVISAQMPLFEKEKLSDFVIQNEGQKIELQKKLEGILKEMGV